MKIKFGDLSIGGKFSLKFPAGTVCMKIRETKEECGLEGEKFLYPRNVAIIEGPKKGAVSFCPDCLSVEPIP